MIKDTPLPKVLHGNNTLQEMQRLYSQNFQLEIKIYLFFFFFSIGLK
jgi:hypothetical protein